MLKPYQSGGTFKPGEKWWKSLIQRSRIRNSSKPKPLAPGRPDCIKPELSPEANLLAKMLPSWGSGKFELEGALSALKFGRNFKGLVNNRMPEKSYERFW